MDSATRLDTALHQANPAVLILDINADDGRKQISVVQQRWKETIIVVLGAPRSQPVLEVESVGVYAVEDIALERRSLQATVVRALDYLKVTQENNLLKVDLARASAIATQRDASDTGSGKPATASPLRALSRAFRKFGDLESLLHEIVEGVSSSLMVSRAGIFSRPRESDTYKLSAGLRCLPETSSAGYSEQDPFVRWLEVNARVVADITLEHVKDPEERILLKRALDGHGAEIILPLHAHQQIIGWLFVGQRVTGLPFSYNDLEELMATADYISAMMDNAILYEEVAVQKTLAETLLDAMPLGIVATGMNGVVHCFNHAAEKILGLEADQVVNSTLDCLGSRLASLLANTLKGEFADESLEWVDPKSCKPISVRTRGLVCRDMCVGAVALIRDLTTDRMIRQKEEELERASLVAELAAAMSHEIRNPMVAVKTFAQLLPERRDDPEFCNEFNTLALQEIDRLLSIVDQIHEIAHPPDLESNPIDLGDIVKAAVNSANKKYQAENIEIETLVDDQLPLLHGDEYALEQCFKHIIANSVEALTEQKHPSIKITVKNLNKKNGSNGYFVSISDNGNGIPESILTRVFSPFCTTKHSSLGLGLSIVKRTVVEHSGTVNIDTGANGTTIEITLLQEKHANERKEPADS